MIKPIGFDNWLSHNFITDSTGRDFTIIGSFAQVQSGAWRVYRGPNVTAVTAASPAVITTTEVHGFHDQQEICLDGFPGALAAILDGIHTVTVLSPTTFSVPVDNTPGSGGYAASVAGSTLGARTIAGVAIEFTVTATGTAYIPGKNCVDAHGNAWDRAWIG